MIREAAIPIVAASDSLAAWLPSGGPKSISETSAKLALGPLVAGSQATQCRTLRSGKGAHSAPCDPPGSRAGVVATEGGDRLRNFIPTQVDGLPAAVGKAAMNQRDETVARDP